MALPGGLYGLAWWVVWHCLVGSVFGRHFALLCEWCACMDIKCAAMQQLKYAAAAAAAVLSDKQLNLTLCCWLPAS